MKKLNEFITNAILKMWKRIKFTAGQSETPVCPYAIQNDVQFLEDKISHFEEQIKIAKNDLQETKQLLNTILNK